MSKGYKGKTIACIDMGSSKIVCVIAAISGNNVRFLGYSHKESKGISSGAISDMRLAQKSITSTVIEAERMASVNIEKLVVSISGNQTKSSRLESSVKISSSMVKSSDIANLASKVRADFRRKNRETIHLIPLQYNIDDSSVVENPRYMSGNKLFAKFHALTTSKTTTLNIENCLKKCQISVNNYISEPFASALACLSENEMNLGTLLIDFGGDVTSFSLILEGKLVYVSSVPIGGNHITKDIATILGIDYLKAEKIKNLNSSLLLSNLEEEEKMTDFNSQEENKLNNLTKKDLRDIIQCRIEEILDRSKKVIEESQIPDFLINKIVLTGGVCQTIGIDKITEEIYEKDVRIGYPNNLKNIPEDLNSTSYCTIIGMLIFSRNLLLKEKIKGGFEVKNSWFKNLIEKLAMG